MNMHTGTRDFLDDAIESLQRAKIPFALVTLDYDQFDTSDTCRFSTRFGNRTGSSARDLRLLHQDLMEQLLPEIEAALKEADKINEGY